MDRPRDARKRVFVRAILVDDGSSDGSWEEVERLKRQYPAIRGIGFARNYGKSAALYCGFAAA